jgi:hypothetical protein
MKASAVASLASQLRHLARLTFVAFLLTFIASRTLVILIMARKMPDLFLHLGGTHVHHRKLKFQTSRLNDPDRARCFQNRHWRMANCSTPDMIVQTRLRRGIENLKTA